MKRLSNIEDIKNEFNLKGIAAISNNTCLSSNRTELLLNWDVQAILARLFFNYMLPFSLFSLTNTEQPTRKVGFTQGLATLILYVNSFFTLITTLLSWATASAFTTGSFWRIYNSGREKVNSFKLIFKIFCFEKMTCICGYKAIQSEKHLIPLTDQFKTKIYCPSHLKFLTVC